MKTLKVLFLALVIISLITIAPPVSLPSTFGDAREYELDYKPWKGATEIAMWVESTGISGRTYIIGVYDCDDMAMDLYFIALKEKRLVGLLQQDYEGWGGKKRLHTLNFTIYGNVVYAIDPISGKVWDICWLDHYPASWKIIKKGG